MCPIDTRRSMYSNIVLSGATTMFAGFSSRLENEMKQLYYNRILKKPLSKESSKIIDIVDTPRRKYSVFAGASFLAQFYESQPDYWITKEEWQECGNRIIHDKCQNMIK
jgi:actin-related protein 2